MNKKIMAQVIRAHPKEERFFHQDNPSKSKEIKESRYKRCVRFFSAPFRFLGKIFCYKKNHAKEDRKIREKLSEKEIDKTINDSFPASDPPSTY